MTIKPKKMWAGIVDDKVDITEERCDWNVIMAIYPYKKTAESKYELVIPVLVTPIMKGRAK